MDEDYRVCEARSRSIFHHDAVRLDTSDPAYESQNAASWADARAWGPRQCNLWIWGPQGTGKTYMARCLANACIDHCYVVAEITGIELDAISKRFDWLDRLDDFAQVPVLLLDDLDKARWSEDGITALWWLIDQRWDNHRRTIISANWDPERFIEAITKARPDNATLAGTLMDRLSWTNKPCKRIQLRGASLRQGLPK